MKVARKIEELRRWLGARRRGKSVGFVPTMGDLHSGHLALILRCKAENPVTVVSIFVNPRQFNDRNDFLKYRRNEREDLQKAKKTGVDLVFAPDESELYPPGFQLSIKTGSLS